MSAFVVSAVILAVGGIWWMVALPAVTPLDLSGSRAGRLAMA